MLTEKAIEHRRNSDDRLKSFLRIYLSTCKPEIKQALEGLVNLEDLRVPHNDHIADFLWPIDIISAVVRYKELNVAFIDYRDEESSEDGVGKTSILVKVLGINIDYNFYRKVLAQEESYENRGYVTPSYSKLIASDIGYFGIKGNRLTVASIIGERLLFLSDLARHIYRMASADYCPQVFQTDAGKEGFAKVLSHLDYELIQKCFLDAAGPFSIDLVFLLKRHRQSSREGLVDKLLDLDESRDALHQSLLNPLYHCSPHWDRSRDLHSRNAANISQCCLAVPVYMIDIYSPHMCYPVHQLVETVRTIIENNLG